MAPSSPAAAESSPAVTSAAEGQRSLPTPFLSKTYQLVEDSSVDDVISWNSDGSAFVVWRPAEFARDLLPKSFKHNNFSSFVRQLNTYGFRKIVPDRWEFANDCFRRGERRLLCDIHRRKITSPAAPATTQVTVAAVAAVAVNPEESAVNSGEEHVLSSNSSPTASTEAAPPDLAADNERLRKENLRLSRELGQMKNLCNSIYALISKFSGGGAAPVEAIPSAEMELFPAGSSADSKEKAEAVSSLNPKLFGFPIRMKRVRQEEDPTGDVKLEPVTWTDPQDDGSGPGSWALYCSRLDAGNCNR